jgi:hypothetical protein
VSVLNIEVAAPSTGSFDSEATREGRCWIVVETVLLLTMVTAGENAAVGVSPVPEQERSAVIVINFMIPFANGYPSSNKSFVAVSYLVFVILPFFVLLVVSRSVVAKFQEPEPCERSTCQFRQSSIVKLMTSCGSFAGATG